MGAVIAAGDNKDAFKLIARYVRKIDNLYDQDYPPLMKNYWMYQSYYSLLFLILLSRTIKTFDQWLPWPTVK